MRSNKRNCVAILSLVLALGIAATASSPVKLAYALEDNTPDAVTDETIIYQKAPNGPIIHASDIEIYDTDNILTVWHEDFGGDSGNIMFSYSSDAGTSWSAAQYMYLMDSSWKYGNIALANKDGVLYAYIGRVPRNAANSEAQKIVAKRSLDKGHTWEDVPLSLTFTKPTIIGGSIIRDGDNFLMPFHRNDYADGALTRYQGILESTDMVNWGLKAIIPNPNNAFLQEGFLDRHYEDPSKLVMVMRTNAGGFAYTSESSDGGATWTNAAPNTNLPNYNSKAPFATTTEAVPRYVYIYNTTSNRSTLNYRTKLPSQDWTAPRLFADYSSGKDEYPMMEEYAPGKFYTVAQSSNATLLFRKLDTTVEPEPAATAFEEDWDNMSQWSASTTGIHEISPPGQLHMKSSGTLSNVFRTDIDVQDSYAFETRLQINDFSTKESCGIKVSNGTVRLMLRVESDGIYVLENGSTAYAKKLNTPTDGAWHTYRVIVSGETAEVYVDDMDTAKFSYTLQPNTTAKRIEHWVSATAGDPAEIHLDYTRLGPVPDEPTVDTVINEDWDSLDNWALGVSGVQEITPPSQLHIASSGTVSHVYREDVDILDNYLLETKLRVGDYSKGESCGIKVSNGTARLMLRIENDGVYVLEANTVGYSKKYAAPMGNDWHTVKVIVNNSIADVYIDDLTTLKFTFTLQPHTAADRVEHWSSATAADPAEFYVDYTKLSQ